MYTIMYTSEHLNLKTVIFILSYSQLQKGKVLDKKLLGTVLVEGLSFQSYLNKSEEKLKNFEQFDVEPDEENKYGYLKLNNQRMDIRVRSFSAAPATVEYLSKINEELVWMVLVADWCGDCSQNLPVIFKLTEINPLFHLRLLPRDYYPQIMDKYLTNGARSIPKVVVMKMDGTELFTWGDKPQPAEELVNQCKKEGMVKTQILEKLHLWYGKDRGKTTESELLELMKKYF